MNTVLQRASMLGGKPNLRVQFEWSWQDRAWGYCDEFKELGFAALVLGALHIQFDWDV
jgi:hypothetical protein